MSKKKKMAGVVLLAGSLSLGLVSGGVFAAQPGNPGMGASGVGAGGIGGMSGGAPTPTVPSRGRVPGSLPPGLAGMATLPPGLAGMATLPPGLAGTPATPPIQ